MNTIKPRKFGLFIDGEFVPAVSGETFIVHSPIDGAEYAEVSKARAEDIDLAAKAAHVAFTGRWPRMLPFDRGRFLHKIADGIRDRAEDLAIAET